jgi:hypothetical protein
LTGKGLAARTPGQRSWRDANSNLADGVLGCLAAVADFRAQFRDSVAQGEYFLMFRPESAQGDGLFVNFTLSDRH